MLLAQEDQIGWTEALLVMIGVGVLLVGAGLLIMSVARKAADGRLGPNALAGIRTRTTRSSAEAWQAAHQAGLRPTLLAGWASIASGVIALIAGIIASSGGDDPNRAMLVWSITMLSGTALLVGLVIYGATKGQAAARQVRDSHPD